MLPLAALGSCAVAAPLQASERPDSAVITVVSIAKQRIMVYGPQGLLAQSPVSTGRRGHDTPTGVFTILQRNRHHRSNLYDDAPMPYMQRLTWSGIALHAGYVPGYPASHGCIRMPTAFAAKMWETTQLGARVFVVPDDEAPREVAHARLPAPTLFPAVATLGPSLRTASVEGESKSDAPPSLSAPRLLNPVERAARMKELLAAEAAERRGEAKASAARAAAAAREANVSARLSRTKQRQASDWQARATYLEKVIAKQRHPALLARLETQKAEAQTRASGLVQEIEASLEKAHAAADDALDAASAAWDAAWKSERAAAAAKSAEKAAAGHAISVFVSRKTGRVQVRQGWDTVHDAPAVFKDADAPLGTHVFVASEPIGGGEALRWLSVSFKGAPSRPPAAQKSGKAPLEVDVPKETAEGVLETFELAPESARFISERLWTGATLIVSDQGPSHETGKHTDFVILTR